ncbi:MAG: hypothetical protein U5K00_22375 [Melioribacteraceae bacterium]|nr:hypothetical protein [Melioribacteraceae bacterium]
MSFLFQWIIIKVMELMGSFITGMHSILINWAEFTVDKDKSLNMNQVLETMLKSPQEARNVLLSEKIFKTLKKRMADWNVFGREVALPTI